MYRADIAATLLALTVAVAFPPSADARPLDQAQVAELTKSAAGKDISFRIDYELDLFAESLRAVGKDIS